MKNLIMKFHILIKNVKNYCIVINCLLLGNAKISQTYLYGGICKVYLGKNLNGVTTHISDVSIVQTTSSKSQFLGFSDPC